MSEYVPLIIGVAGIALDGIIFWLTNDQNDSNDKYVPFFRNIRKLLKRK